MNKNKPGPRPLLAPLLAAVVLLTACTDPAPPPPTAAPATVGVHRVAAERLTVTTELPGRTRAWQVAEIRPQVGGLVQRRLFEEGSRVTAGQVLYQLDATSFRASVASAQASLARAEAVLAAARATARRDAELVAIDAISQQQADDSAAAVQQAQADVAVSRAALATARIDLERTRITAPIAGRIELSTVTPGALVTANQETALTTVQQTDPIVVDVVQSSSELLQLRRDLASGVLQRAGPGSGAGADEAPIRLLLEDGSEYPQAGRLQFAGVTVDPGTGAVTLRAVVPNPDGLLMPGMYVRARLQTGVAEQALLVPQQGVTRTPSGNATALVVGADDKVERRDLKVERAVGARWQVVEGLRPGDRLIVDGLQRARVGQVVRPVDAAEVAGTPVAAASAVRAR